jgi:outer membrane protein
MMGIPMDQGLAIQPFEPKAIEDQIGVGVSLDSGLNLNNRLEYTILNKEVELEGFQLKANKAEFYPSLAFNASYSTNGVSDNFDFIGHGTTAVWYQIGYISLNLTVPLFDGGNRRSRVHQAQIQIDEYKKQAEQTASQLDMDYRNAKLNLATSITNIHAQKDNVDLAYEVYQTTQSNYKVGLSTLTDLLDSENSFLTAQHNYYVSLLQYKLAEIGLIKANGNLKSLLN